MILADPIDRQYVGLDGISWPIVMESLWTQAWTMAGPSSQEFIFQVNAYGRSAGYIASDNSINVVTKHDVAGAENRHNPASLSPGVVQIGKWLVGPKDPNHFVISHRDLKDNDPPSFLLRYDGALYSNKGLTTGTPAPASYLLDVLDDDTETLTHWVIGEQTASGCFVIQRAAATVPSLVG